MMEEKTKENVGIINSMLILLRLFAAPQHGIRVTSTFRRLKF
jgi:hypothetical protein